MDQQLIDALFKSVEQILIPVLVGALAGWLGKLIAVGDKALDNLIIKHVTREQLVAKTFDTPAEQKRQNVIEAVKQELSSIKAQEGSILPAVLSKSIWPEPGTDKIAKVLEERVGLIKGAMREAETQIKIKSDPPVELNRPGNDGADILIGEFILPKDPATLADVDIDE